MRGRFIWDTDARDWIPREEYFAKHPPVGAGLQIIRDIEPFRSVATPDMPVIGGRRQLRDYCRAHDLVARGNDPLPERKASHPPVRDDLRTALRQHGL